MKKAATTPWNYVNRWVWSCFRSRSKAPQMTLEEIREYAEGYPVDILQLRNGRWCVQAHNQSGHDATQVDLVDLVRWLHEHRPDILEKALLPKS